ncbi:hypothetical protein SAMN02745135_02115, partial [Caloranaerobacter azorensis DSM 13643]
MKSLIINLTNTIRILYVLVIYLLIPYFKNPIKPRTNKPISKPYRKIEVDTELPIIETIEVPNYK